LRGALSARRAVIDAHDPPSNDVFQCRTLDDNYAFYNLGECGSWGSGPGSEAGAPPTDGQDVDEAMDYLFDASERASTWQEEQCEKARSEDSRLVLVPAHRGACNDAAQTGRGLRFGFGQVCKEGDARFHLHDDPDWLYQGGSGVDCAWIARTRTDDELREWCNKRANDRPDQTKVYEVCAATCSETIEAC
jgi:hypothetical protein